MKKLFYPALFHEAEEGGFWVSFPDIPECLTEGDDMETAYEMAVNALGLALISREEEKEPIPIPSPPNSLVIKEDHCFLVIVELAQQRLTTLEEYEALSEDTRAEVFDGQIQFMASPSQVHQDISRELLYVLTDYIKKKNGPCKTYSAPFDVKLNDRPLTIVQPDLMIICDKDKLDGKRCNGAPDFIIEITSPGNASDDYVRKLYYYKNYGVREYWIVDPNRHTVTVNYFEGDSITVQYPFGAAIKVNIYDDLFIDFKAIEQMLNS